MTEKNKIDIFQRYFDISTASNIKYGPSLSCEKNEIVIISTRHPTCQHIKSNQKSPKICIYLQNFFQIIEVFLPVHHETSHMDLHSLKIQFKVEY